MDTFFGIKIADNWISIASAIVAAVSALIAFISAIEAKRKGKRDVVELQLKYFDNMRKWADASALYLTEAIHLCDLEPTRVEGEKFFDRRHRLLIALSHQADIGRWFFPNVSANGYGDDKPEGYRGLRDEVLDGLLIAYNSVGRMDYREKNNNARIRSELVEAKRKFIGKVQLKLDPARQQEEFDKVARSKR